MLSQRPFRNNQHVYESARLGWRQLSPAAWLEAFSRHPRIGDLSGSRVADRAWAEGEQRGAAVADASVRAALAEGNREYEGKFGFVFLICATGKSGLEMLESLRRRQNNNRETELAIAAEEQEKITRIRLEKLLSP
jgi:2-oxo-4-hydroxy-4-carboxy-5-ureidoimidazoline decarboxylase